MGKREDILEATRDLIAEEGIQAFSFPKVFARAGVGSGTVYHYFSGKEVLIAAVYRQASDVMDREILADYDPAATIADRFHAMMHNLFRFVSQRWRELAVLDSCRHMPALAEENLRRNPPSVAATFALLDEGRKQGLFLPIDGLIASTMLLGAIRAVVEGHRAGKFILDDRAMAQVIEACWRALADPQNPAARGLPATAGSDSSP